jgi:hypothetical protein
MKKKLFSYKARLLSFVMAVCMTFTCVQLNTYANTSEASVLPEVDVAAPEAKLQPVILEEDITKRGEYEKHFLCDDGSFIAVSYPHPVHSLIDGQWADVEAPLTEEGGQIVYSSKGDVFSLAKSTNIAEDGELVRIGEGENALRWTVAITESASKLQTGNSTGKSIKATLKKNVTASVEKETTSKLLVNDELLAQKNAAAPTLSLAESGKLTAQDAKMVKDINASIEEANRKHVHNASFGWTTVEYPDAFGEGVTLRYILSTGRVKEEVIIDGSGKFESHSMKMDTSGLIAVLQEDIRDTVQG